MHDITIPEEKLEREQNKRDAEGARKLVHEIYKHWCECKEGEVFVSGLGKAD